MSNNVTFPSTNISKALVGDVSSPPIFELCSILRPVGYYFIFLWIVGIVLSGSVLYILIRNKHLRQSSTNILIGGLLLADFIGSCFELPLPAFSLLYCRWLFTYVGCVYEAMIVYFAGCSNMYMLCLISIDRYSVMISPPSARIIRIKRTYVSICCAYLLAFFWTIMPLFGWSAYDYEGIGVSCSVTWVGRSLNVISYNVTVFTFVYFIPIMIILITNIKIYRLIRSRLRSSTVNTNQHRVRRQYQIERRVLGTITLIIGGFFIAWTPYAVVALIHIFFNANYFSPIMNTIPALFAKTSLVWNPLIYTMRNVNFHTHLPFCSRRHCRSQEGNNRNEIKFAIYPYSMVRLSLQSRLNLHEQQ